MKTFGCDVDICVAWLLAPAFWQLNILNKSVETVVCSTSGMRLIDMLREMVKKDVGEVGVHPVVCLSV